MYIYICTDLTDLPIRLDLAWLDRRPQWTLERVKIRRMQHMFGGDFDSQYGYIIYMYIHKIHLERERERERCWLLWIHTTKKDGSISWCWHHTECPYVCHPWVTLYPEHHHNTTTGPCPCIVVAHPSLWLFRTLPFQLTFLSARF